MHGYEAYCRVDLRCEAMSNKRKTKIRSYVNTSLLQKHTLLFSQHLIQTNIFNYKSKFLIMLSKRRSNAFWLVCERNWNCKLQCTSFVFFNYIIYNELEPLTLNLIKKKSFPFVKSLSFMLNDFMLSHFQFFFGILLKIIFHVQWKIFFMW